MPVTAKLSREFYDKIGDAVVNELVNLLNLVDAGSRSDLRQLNESNFARLDARLGQRFAESAAEVRTSLSDLGARLSSLEQRMDRGFADAERAREKGGDALRVEMIKWMFLFWSGTTLAGLLLK